MPNNLSLPQGSPDPCIRLMRQGAPSLSDPELLAVMLGRPRLRPSDLVAAERLLGSFGHLGALARAGARELAEVRGIDAHAAARLEAAFEAGRRSLTPPWPDDEPFSDPEDIWAHFRTSLGGLDREVFLAIGIDARCHRVCEARVADGGLAHCIVDPRDVFLPMLRGAAHRVVLVHNHPSGDPTPSDDDRRLTARLAMAGRVLGLDVVDHVIIGRSAYHSMASDGSLP